MYEIIMNLEDDKTNGNQNYCLISEEKLNAMKTLAKKEKEEHDKLLAENTMLKSNEIINSQKTKDLKNKHKKELEEKNKEIKNLKERLSSLEYKQVDIFEKI